MQLHISQWPEGKTVTVAVHSASGDDPGSSVATLSNPARATGKLTFTAPSGVTLSAGTDYFVVVSSDAAEFEGPSIRSILADGEDSGGTVGWSIADTGREAELAQTTWTDMPNGRSLHMAVWGQGPAPTGSAPSVVAPSGTAGALKVTWTAPAGGATAYEVKYWEADTDGRSFSGPKRTTETTLPILLLEAGDEYKVAVRARTAAGWGPWSASTTRRTGRVPSSETPVLTLAFPDGTTVATVGEEDVFQFRYQLENLYNSYRWNGPYKGVGCAPLSYTWRVRGSARSRAGQTLVRRFFTPTSVTSGYWEYNEGFDGGAADKGPVTIRLESPGPDPHLGSCRAAPTYSKGSPREICVQFEDGDVATSAADMRDHALTVTGGTVTDAAHVDGRADLWRFTVTPSGTANVSILLAGGRACSEAGATCTANSGQLSNGLLSLILYVAAVPVQIVPAALTASFSGVPDEHTGESFTFRLRFSEDVAGLSYKTLRDAAFSVTNGQVRRARRKQKGSNQRWNITVKPDSSGAVTIRLPATTDCEADDAICTSDARRLSNSLSATIPGAAAALNFAHFAKGAAITSEMVLVNAAPQPSRPAVYFYDTKGDPIAPESVVDLTGDLEVTEDGGLTVWTQMEPLGELTISTHGRGEPVSGSVKVLSDGPIGGVIRYSVPEIGVAGVGASPPVSDALFPVRRQAGGIRTAAALHNLEAEAMGVTCRLMSGGGVLEEVEIHLEANGQASWFIEDAFTTTDTSDFGGSVRCAAPGNGRFTAVAVEMDAANRIFTTLPVVPVDPPGSGNQQTTLDFAHFANGTGITSEMVFLNPSTQPSRPAVYFYDTGGDPIAPESVVDLTGDLEVTEDGALTVWTQMEPLGELTISTHGRGELVTGSGRVISDGPMGGLLALTSPASARACSATSPICRPSISGITP